MTKSDLVASVANATGMTQADAKSAVEATLSHIKSGVVAEGNVTLKGFGTFKSVVTKERDGRNPKTGETIKIASKTKVKFSASSEFLD